MPNLPMLENKRQIHNELLHNIPAVIYRQIFISVQQCARTLWDAFALRDSSSPAFILLGMTHGGKLKEKLLKKQLEKDGRSDNALVAVLVWEKILTLFKELKWPIVVDGCGAEKSLEIKNAVIECYISLLIDEISDFFQGVAFGMICDANLGILAGSTMSYVVTNVIATHPKISLLRLFTATETCQFEATQWAQSKSAHKRYKLSMNESVQDHSKISDNVRLLITKLNELGEKNAVSLRSFSNDSELIPEISALIDNSISSTRTITKLFSAQRHVPRKTRLDSPRTLPPITFSFTKKSLRLLSSTSLLANDDTKENKRLIGNGKAKQLLLPPLEKEQRSEGGDDAFEKGNFIDKPYLML